MDVFIRIKDSRFRGQFPLGSHATIYHAHTELVPLSYHVVSWRPEFCPASYVSSHPACFSDPWMRYWHAMHKKGQDILWAGTLMNNFMFCELWTLAEKGKAWCSSMSCLLHFLSPVFTSSKSLTYLILLHWLHITVLSIWQKHLFGSQFESFHWS